MSRHDFRPWFRKPAARTKGASRDVAARGVILGGVIGLHVALLAALLSYRILLPEAPDGPVIRLDLPPLASPPQQPGPRLLPVPLPSLVLELQEREKPDAAARRAAPQRTPDELMAEEALTPAVAANSLAARGFDLISPPSYAAPRLGNRLPAYPPAARRQLEEGVVILRVLVNPAGRSQSVEIHRSSGHARLDRAAAQAVMNWAFIPAARGRQPVTAWLLVPIRFTGGSRVMVDESVSLSGEGWP